MRFWLLGDEGFKEIQFAIRQEKWNLYKAGIISDFMALVKVRGSQPFKWKKYIYFFSNMKPCSKIYSSVCKKQMLFYYGPFFGS